MLKKKSIKKIITKIPVKKVCKKKYSKYLK